jgi:hypothetical protein
VAGLILSINTLLEKSRSELPNLCRFTDSHVFTHQINCVRAVILKTIEYQQLRQSIFTRLTYSRGRLPGPEAMDQNLDGEVSNEVDENTEIYQG